MWYKEAIAVIRTLQERCLEHDQDVYVCYVDFEKAFDRVNWEILMEQVKKFRYLGVIITEDGRCDVEIETRIGMAKDAFNKRRELLSQRMDRKLKKKIIKAVVWSVALYGSETWTMRKNEIDRLRAFEMWILRRMEKMWIGHVLRGNYL